MVQTAKTGPYKSLVHILETQVNESETTAYEVGEQRERNHRYYALGQLGNEIKGRSHYISPDVMDAVEGKKALFSETFLSARDVCKFTKCKYQGEAEAKTAYANQAYKRNDYEALFRDGWHDAFVAKKMQVMVDWFYDTKETTIPLNGVPVPMLNQYLQNMPQVVEVDDSGVQGEEVPTAQGPVTLLYGELIVHQDDSFPRLTLIQPERYFRDPDAAYVKDSAWVTVEEDLTRGRLIDLGFNYDQVMRLPSEYRFRSDEEDNARKRHDSSWTRRHQANRTDEQELLSYYRTFTWLDYSADDNVSNAAFDGASLNFEPKPGYRLYEIHWCAGEVMLQEDVNPETDEPYAAISEAEEIPIFEWTEMKISHAENGLCTSDVVAHTQKTSSVLKRLVIENQTMVNSTRYLALTNTIKNTRDLMDNKIGAIIWAKRPDAVTPLATPLLSPNTMDTIMMLKQDGEERSGISGLAKGMNSDAVKYQNADNMIERLTTAGQRRVTAAARDFANTFLVPLTQYIVHLGMREDQSTDQVEVAGQMRDITPSQWQDDALKMDVAVALTPEEGQRMAQQLLTMNGMISQDPDMKLSYGVEQKHALYDAVYELIGISDSTPFLLAPSDPKYQQAGMQQQQEMTQLQQKNDMIEGLALKEKQLGMQLAQSTDRREWEKFQWDQTDDMADNNLDSRKQDWDEKRDVAEYSLEKEQGRAASIGT